MVSSRWLVGCTLVALVAAVLLVPGATAAANGKVVVYVKQADEPVKPVKGVEVFLGVTPKGGDFEARFKCTNKKGRAVFKGVPKNATLISATGLGARGRCSNAAFLFKGRPLLTQFYKDNNGRVVVTEFSLGNKASMRLDFRPIYWPAHELCADCKYRRQFDEKLRKALNLWYKTPRKAGKKKQETRRKQSIRALKNLRRPLVVNEGGRFDEPDGTQFWGPEFIAWLGLAIDRVKSDR